MSATEARFWKLYRSERRKVADSRTELRASQVVRCAQLARQRLDAER